MEFINKSFRTFLLIGLQLGAMYIFVLIFQFKICFVMYNVCIKAGIYDRLSVPGLKSFANSPSRGYPGSKPEKLNSILNFK